MKRLAHSAVFVLLGVACSTPAAEPEATSTPAQHLLAASVRRLSVAELNAAASALVGSNVDWTSALPPDARQNDYSRSLSQSVDASTLRQLERRRHSGLRRLGRGGRYVVRR